MFRTAVADIRHMHRADLKYAHNWGSGWVGPAIASLLDMSRDDVPAAKDDGRPR